MKHLLLIVKSLVLALLLGACDDLSVIGNTDRPKSLVREIGQVSARPGDLVDVKGQNFSEDLQAYIGDKDLSLSVVNSTSALFAMPSGLTGKIFQIEFVEKSKVVAKFPILNGEIPQGPSRDPQDFCSDSFFRGASGELMRGERDCNKAPVACTDDAQVNCRTTVDRPAIAIDGLAAKVIAGSTVAAVSGTIPPRPADCAADSGLDCVAVSSFPALDKSRTESLAAHIQSGVSVLGIAGTLADCAADGASNCRVDGVAYKAADLSISASDIRSGTQMVGITGSMSVPSHCASDAEVACLANASFPAVDKVGTLQANASLIRSSLTIAGVPGTLDNCSSDGGTACVVLGPTYAAASVAGAAAKILLGQNLAGIAGSAALRPIDCSNDGQSGCVAVASHPAIKIADLTTQASKIRSTLTLAGVPGTMDDCSLDGEISCFTHTNFPAISRSHLISEAGKIRSTLSIAAVAGTLGNCASDAEANCVAVAGFPAMDKSTAAVKILSGQSLAGVSGTAAGRPADCALDGGTNCTTVAAYPAIDPLSASKIGTGQSLGGILGTGAVRPANCALDAATDCVAVTNYPAVKLSDLNANLPSIRSNFSIAGVTGTLPTCAADGVTGCVTSAAYPAAEVAGAAAKILTSQTLAGIGGSAPIRPADCALDGGLDCVAVALFPAAKASIIATRVADLQVLGGITGTAQVGRPADCLSDAETGCVSVSAFPAVQVAGAASKIALGQTLAGIAGSAAARPSNCGSDGETNCVAVAAYPATDHAHLLANAAKIQDSVTLTDVSGTLGDCASDAGIDCVTVPAYPAARVTGSAAKILTGQSLAGISGSAAVRPADCAADGASNCVAVALFPALDKSTLSGNANKVRSSLTIQGVTGTLLNCSVDGGTGCVTGASFPAAEFSGAAAKILAGQSVAGISGSAATRPAECSSDGGMGCVTNASYPALDTSALTGGVAKIQSSLSIAGVSGTLPSCVSDGTLGCQTTASFPSANTSGAAAKILSAQTLAGISGTAAIKPSDCSVSGGENCVAVSDYPAVNKAAITSNAAKIRTGTSVVGVAGTAANCSVDGGTACVSVSGFPAALAAGAAAKILSGQTLAAINGSAGIRPSDCAADAAVDCVAISNFPASDKSNVTSNAAKFRTSLTIAGVSGTLGDCSTDNGSTCVTSTAYPSVIKANVTAGLIKKGTIVAGVTGDYPSSTYPMAVGDAHSDLLASTFETQMRTATTFGWYDRAGTRYTQTGDSDIAAGNIRVGKTIFGITGTWGTECSSDGQSNGCFTNSTYKAGNTAAYTTWDIRYGRTLGGVTGSLVFVASAAQLSVFNRTTGTGASSSTTAPDVYDSVSEDANGSSLPSQALPGQYYITGWNVFLRASNSDNGAGGGTASNGVCDGTEDCVYLDQMTNLYWAKSDTTRRDWETVIAYCDGLTYGGYSNWRVPTQKEAMQAYNNGLWRLATPLNIQANRCWTGTTNPSTTTAAFSIDYYQGLMWPDDKVSQTRYVMCTR